jgi:CheY-like chemotaxis protein
MVENVKTLRALVVDDDRMIQTIIRANLESIGITPVVAGNGVEAIDAMKKNEIDFILMDIRMPDQDGLDATRWIRDIEFSDTIRHVPIFALTTYSSDAHTQEILDAGMNEHLVKPFKLENLLPLLDKYFPGAVNQK